MSDFENNTELMAGLSGVNLANNRRIATRFIREDISASISDLGLFQMNKVKPVTLMDISSKGALIATDQKLGINKKIKLKLLFKSGKAFVIKAIVSRSSDSTPNEYGIDFERYNNELGDYMLESQRKLIFK